MGLISPTLFGDQRLCSLRPAASAYRRQAARARLRAAALLGSPHETTVSAQRCLSAPQIHGELAPPAGFRPGCLRSLPQVRLSHISTAFGQGVDFLSQVPLFCETIESPHPTQPPTVALRSRPLNMSPCPTITSTRGGRDKVGLPPVPHTLARSAIPNILGVARARDSNLSAPPPCFSIPLSSGFPAPVSRAPRPPTCLSARPIAEDTLGLRPRARVRGALVGVHIFFWRRSGARSPICPSRNANFLTYSQP